MNTSTTSLRVRAVAPSSANAPAISVLCQYTALQGEGARALIWFLTTVRESTFFQNKKFIKIPLSFVLGCSYVETFWSFRDLPLHFVSLQLICPNISTWCPGITWFSHFNQWEHVLFWALGEFWRLICLFSWCFSPWSLVVSHTYELIILSWRLKCSSADLWGPLWETLSSLVLFSANASGFGSKAPSSVS